MEACIRCGNSQASELFDIVPLTTISKRLGHSSTRTTSEIYSPEARRRDRDAADVGWKPSWEARSTGPKIM